MSQGEPIGPIDLSGAPLPSGWSIDDEKNWTITVNGNSINLGNGGAFNGQNNLQVLFVYLIKNDAAGGYIDFLNYYFSKYTLNKGATIASVIDIINRHLISVITGDGGLMNGHFAKEKITLENLKAAMNELVKKGLDAKNDPPTGGAMGGAMGGARGGGKKKKSAKGKSKKKKSKTKKRCKKCRCQPCLCKKQIHCYQITCNTKRKSKKRKSKKKSRRISFRGR